MNRIKFWITFALTLTLLSCSEEKGFSELERTEAGFLDKLGGNVSPAQWWRTSVKLNVNVNTDGAIRLMLLSDNGKGTLFDYKEMKGSGNCTMTAPQGKGTTLYLVCITNKRKSVQPITLSGKSEESVTVNTLDPNQQFNARRNAVPLAFEDIGPEDDNWHYDRNVDQSLHTKSVSGGAFHYEFTLPQKLEIVQMLDIMNKNLDAKRGLGLNCDYELESKGPFNITWLAGYAADQAEHILGYYYHSPGTYEDMEFHDLAETHKYDIIDDLAKVQYQIRDTSYAAHPETGILPNRWYDGNFDMADLIGSNKAYNTKRIGDQAYNTMNIFNTFGTGVSRLRGLSFLIDVPVGKRVGFYLKVDREFSTSQWDQLNALGIKGLGMRSEWKKMNFCAEAFNSAETHRSCIIPYENSIWMGVEDRFDGGDFDCNDLLFGITVDMAIYRPEIITPDINLMVDTHDRMPWTLAFEDVARDADFDFNDAVIKLTPDYDNETCCVTVEAAGAPSRMYLHYDGPDGDVNLGEIHEILGGEVGHKINTQTSMIQYPVVEIDCVPWPKSYNMADDARRFWIEVQRGTCEDCTDAITFANRPGETPEAILVAGEWRWPREGVHIFSAYNNFPNWAKDVNKTSYWNWYANPKSGTVISF